MDKPINSKTFRPIPQFALKPDSLENLSSPHMITFGRNQNIPGIVYRIAGAVRSEKTS